jgi:hypothetical protein
MFSGVPKYLKLTLFRHQPDQTLTIYQFHRPKADAGPYPIEYHDFLLRSGPRNAKCAALSQFSEWVGILSSASNFLHVARIILVDEGFIGQELTMGK